MPKKGRDLLLKEGDGASPETFATVAGLRPTSFTIDGETVDVTHKGSAGWRDLLPEGGTTSISISAGGVNLSAEDTISNLRDRAIAKTLHAYQLDDGEDVLEGDFQITSFEVSGGHDEEQSFSITLESSGEVTVTDG